MNQKMQIVKHKNAWFIKKQKKILQVFKIATVLFSFEHKWKSKNCKKLLSIKTIFKK